VRSAWLLGVVAVCVFAGTAAAQSSQPDLAAIARAAEAARPSLPKAKKTYTNADLKPDVIQPAVAAAPPVGFMSDSLDKPVSAEELLALSEAKDAADTKQREPDQYWVGQASRIRSQVDHLSPRLQELQGRQKNPNAVLQKRTEQEIAMIQQQLEGFRKRWAGLEEAARMAKINLALISPPPAFPQ